MPLEEKVVIHLKQMKCSKAVNEWVTRFLLEIHVPDSFPLVVHMDMFSAIS